MTAQIFPLKDHVTTRHLNKTISQVSNDLITSWINTGRLPSDFAYSRNLDRTGGERRYVYGLGSELRSTLIGHYIVGSGEIMLVFPNNYNGFQRASSYDQLRVSIRDRLVYESNLVDHGELRLRILRGQSWGSR